MVGCTSNKNPDISFIFLTSHPGYTLVVNGYSLGAGLAQLFLLDLQHGESKSQLPPGVKIRGVLFGCPPVFQGNFNFLNNVIMVSNHNDGVTGLSLKTADEVLLKARAIHKLNLQRRTLLKMALNITNEELDEAMEVQEDYSAKNENKKHGISSGLMKRTKQTMSKMLNGTTQDLWDKVQSTAEEAAKSPHPEMTFTGRTLLVVKKAKTKEEPLVISKFSGEEELYKFSHQIRFKFGMMDDHMPWGYNGIFASKLILISCNSI